MRSAAEAWWRPGGAARDLWAALRGGARSIGEDLSRRSTLTIRHRRPLSAQNRPSKRSDETATTALQESQVAPVPDLLALAVLPYRADPMTSRRFQIGEATLSANDPQLAPALADAHARRIRPLCLCREPAAPMYVARVAGQFIPKRMPGTGAQHDPGCESYEAPPELSGFGDLVGRAIQEDVDAGVTVLRLGFSLSRTGRRPAPGPVTREADSVKADASKLSLKATLHYLWEEAGFNRWSERMTGKRNWFIIRKHLLQAAENKTAKGAPLSDVLYIPEVFSAERKTELAQRHLSAVNKIAAGATGPRRLMLLIGEVKEFAAARSGHKLVVKHLPELLLPAQRGLHRRMTARFEREITLWDAVAGAHLIVIATFGVAPGGVPTSKNWR